MEFVDRLLTCADCRQDFIFTAGEQLFFFDKQFRNDPKRCKPCKSRRAGGVATIAGVPAAAGISRTETRTVCSECGLETTVPFKPTQGRPVLCRQCFQMKRPAAVPAMPGLPLLGNALLEPIPIPALSMKEATAELVAAASNAAALEHGAGISEAIAVAIELPQA